MGTYAKTAAVVAAAGAGLRMGAGENKVYLPLLGRPVLFWSLKALEDSAAVDWVVVVTDEHSVDRCAEVVSLYGLSKVKKVVPGGATRRESVRRGLLHVPEGTGLIVIHDGARPLVTPELVDRVAEVAAKEGACIPAVEVVDTVKSVGFLRAEPAEEGGSESSHSPGSRQVGYVSTTVDRAMLRLAQTPQAFKAEALFAALERLPGEARVTDDSQLVELAGMPVAVVEGCRENLKITYPSDLPVAGSLLREKMGLPRAPGFRTGIGYDVHRTDPSVRLVLGGVVVADSGCGLAGHSDADVLVHALMDALLGAAGERDIGWWFPSSDARWKGASSVDMLKRVVGVVSRKGYRICNVDSTVVAEWPRLSGYAWAMKERLAPVLRIAPDEIGIKFTTNEGLDSMGAGQGIAAWAVALLERCA